MLPSASVRIDADTVRGKIPVDRLPVPLALDRICRAGNRVVHFHLKKIISAVPESMVLSCRIGHILSCNACDPPRRHITQCHGFCPLPAVKQCSSQIIDRCIRHKKSACKEDYHKRIKTCRYDTAEHDRIPYGCKYKSWYNPADFLFCRPDYLFHTSSLLPLLSSIICLILYQIFVS